MADLPPQMALYWPCDRYPTGGDYLTNFIVDHPVLRCRDWSIRAFHNAARTCC